MHPPRSRAATVLCTAAVALCSLAAAPSVRAQSIIGPPLKSEPPRVALKTPEAFFGFQMGADNKMAHWTDMVRYYELLAKSSNRMKLVNMGKTSEGHPFLALFISSPQNLAKLEHYRGINAKLSDPRGVPDAEIDGARQERQGGRAPVDEHALDRDRRQPDGRRARLRHAHAQRRREQAHPRQRHRDHDSVVQSRRRDHGDRVVPQDARHRGRGHDVRRRSTRSTRATTTTATRSDEPARLALHRRSCCSATGFRRRTSTTTTWAATARASSCRRMPTPCVRRPIRSCGASSSWYGAQMATKEEEYGESGVINDAVYSGWGHMGFHWITPFHNIAGMLTESASARLASPMTMHEGAAAGQHAQSASSTRSRRTSRTRGPAASGICATSWIARRSRRGRRSISRRATRRRCCATRTSRRSIRPSAAQRASRRRSSFRSASSTIRSPR